MDFVKMEGLGNDFIVVDGPFEPDVARIRAWCDRRRGIGADGILEITPVGSDRIRMRYWNRDGGEAEMCGNGLRCLAKLALDRGWVDGPEMIVETAAGDLPAAVLEDGRVRALVGVPADAGDPFEHEGVVVHPIEVGNPHGAVFVDDPAAVDVAALGAAIERHPSFPHGANVEFVAVQGNGDVSMRIWERGVGETLASGTGATSAAFAAITHRGAASPVTVHLPGGELVIDIDDEGRAWMTGPGTYVYAGTVT